MTKKESYDVAVIGSGPGGYVAALRAAQLGMRVVCIEKSATFGGTCLNVGCIPSKALLQSSEQYAFLQHDAEKHGLLFKGLSFDFSKMQQRKSDIVQGLVSGIAGLFLQNRIATCQGSAQFTSPTTVMVSGEHETREIEAKWFILATGSEPIPLPFLPFDEQRVISSTGALNLTAPPKKLLLIGAGVIGVELASVYKRLGSEVVIVEMLDEICPTMDKTISKTLLQTLKKQGLIFHLGTKVIAAKSKNKQVSLEIETAGKKESLVGDVALVAIGRRPFCRGLELGTAGIELSPKGFVPVDGFFRTVQPHIFAIGDLIEGPMLAHRASEEGVAVAEIIAGKAPHVNYMAIPSVIYTFPEVAAVGFTEQEALGYGLKLKIGTSYFKGNARARCIGATDGLVKIIAEKESGRLLGLHIIGPFASEMIGEGVIALNKHATISDIAYASHAHPTLSEAILEAAQKAL